MRDEYRERIAAKINREAEKIQQFLDNPTVVEVMLNADKSVWIDRLQHGITKTGVTFDRDQAMLLIGSIARYNDTSVNEAQPLLKRRCLAARDSKPPSSRLCRLPSSPYAATAPAPSGSTTTYRPE